MLCIGQVIYRLRFYKSRDINIVQADTTFKEKTRHWWIQGGGGYGEPVPPLLGFFFTKAKFTSKISTKRAQNLSQNAGNGHF